MQVDSAFKYSRVIQIGWVRSDCEHEGPGWNFGDKEWSDSSWVITTVCCIAWTLTKYLEKKPRLKLHVTYPWYGYVHNSYIDNIGIPKHKNTYDFLVQVRNFLLPLS